MQDEGILIHAMGCNNWLIQSNNNYILQPTNLSSFNVTLKDSQKVKFEYQINAGQFSICQAGKIINLMHISNE
jgi:hypothetical protein